MTLLSLRPLILLGVIAILLTPFIVSAQTIGVPCDGSPQNPCGFNEFIQLIQNIINFLLLIAAPIASIMFAWGGWLWFTSAGNPGKIDSAKKAITTALIGIGITLGAWLIISTITGELVRDTLDPLSDYPHSSYHLG